jgi:hypothetical protein
MLPGMCINGKTHDLTGIDVETELGTREVWKIVSRGMAHPFHVHGASFRILSLSGAPPPAHLARWKDVVLVEDEAELLVALNRPATREHPFMYHCHILEHEDAGMMGQYASRSDDPIRLANESASEVVTANMNVRNGALGVASKGRLRVNRYRNGVSARRPLFPR